MPSIDRVECKRHTINNSGSSSRSWARRREEFWKCFWSWWWCNRGPSPTPVDVISVPLWLSQLKFLPGSLSLLLSLSIASVSFYAIVNDFGIELFHRNVFVFVFLCQSSHSPRDIPSYVIAPFLAHCWPLCLLFLLNILSPAVHNFKARASRDGGSNNTWVTKCCQSGQSKLLISLRSPKWDYVIINGEQNIWVLFGQSVIEYQGTILSS